MAKCSDDGGAFAHNTRGVPIFPIPDYSFHNIKIR